MPRSRSRSPVLPSSSNNRDRRDRRRSRSRERRHRKKRSRSRSPRYRGSSPPRHRSRSNSPRRRSPSPRSYPKEIIDVDSLDNNEPTQPAPIDKSQFEGVDDEDMDMMKLMGFAAFDSTKGKKVEGTDVSAVNLVRKRRYRQYMNRRGGFNRPLDFVA